MTAEEARTKWESRFWEAYDGAAQASSAPKEMSDGEINNLSGVIDAIALDGFSVQVFEHVSDRMLRGLAFHEITQCDPIKQEKDNA